MQNLVLKKLHKGLLKFYYTLKYIDDNETEY